MKRTLDVVLAGLFLLLLSPLLLLIFLAVRVTMGAPAMFRQVRPGLEGRPFEMLKFRTMREGVELDSLRLTSFGRLLRKTSLDELPELWNIVRGDMSIVGPRPLLMEYLDLYTPEQARRHDVRPGLTGWAQINGRNALSWSEKFELDAWYVGNRSIWLDFKIIALTVFKVLKRSDISADGEATMPRFTGSPKS